MTNAFSKIEKSGLELLPIILLRADFNGILTSDFFAGKDQRLIDSLAKLTEKSITAIAKNPEIGLAAIQKAQLGEHAKIDLYIDRQVFESVILLVSDDKEITKSLLISGIDVTTSRNATNELNVRREQLQALMDTALDAVITCDTNSKIIDWNAGAEKLFGWSRDEAIGLKLTNTIIPEDLRDAHNVGMKHFLSSGKGPVLGSRIEIEALDRSGRRFPIELSINPIKTSNGMMFSAFLRDITPRIERESLLAKNKTRLQTAINSMQAGTWSFEFTKDNELVSIEVDDRQRDLLGNDATKIPPERGSVHDDDKEIIESTWKQLLSGNTDRYEVSYRIHVNTDTISWRRDLAMLTVDDGPDHQSPDFEGKIHSRSKVVGITEDITDAKILETKIQTTTKLEAVGQIASGFAHDLNNVLAAIAGHATLASLPPEIPEKSARSLEVIKGAITKGRTLTQNMLSIGQPNIANRDPFDLGALLRETSKLAEPLLGDGITVCCNTDQNLPLLNSDSSLWQQAILNLLINARDAMSNNGRIDVRLQSKGDETENAPGMTLEVRDQGCGMSQEEIKRAANPFFTTKGRKGTGLGLSMVERMVQADGGHLEIQSKIDQGTSVTLHLSAEHLLKSSSAPTAFPEHPYEPENLNILLVEDHPLLRPMLSEALSNEEHNVTAIGNGEEAVKIALELKPDIMVLDINIPGSRGDEIARRVRQATGTDIPILFITGNNEFEIPDWKNIDLIRKPFELDEMIQRINAFFSP